MRIKVQRMGSCIYLTYPWAFGAWPCKSHTKLHLIMQLYLLYLCRHWSFYYSLVISFTHYHIKILTIVLPIKSVTLIPPTKNNK